MPEPTLVELIEAYERISVVCRKWVVGEHEPDDCDNPVVALYDAEQRLRNRLLEVKGRAAAWKGVVYVATGGELRVVRDIRSADEIDGEGR